VRSHVRPRHTLRAAGLEASAAFYEAVLRTLGRERTYTADWLVEWDVFSLSPANAEKPVTRGLHIAFTAPTREHVDAFWHRGRLPRSRLTRRASRDTSYERG
jgi:hypothetical protein